MPATFKQYRSRAIHRHLDMTQVPVEVAVEGDKKFMLSVSNSTAVPEVEALWFYLRNHAVAALSRVYDPAEPLSPEHEALLDEYHASVQQSALRMYFYLLRICTRETRHAHSSDPVLKQDKYAPLASWYKSYAGTDGGTAISKLLKSPPPVSMGLLSDFLRDMFYMCKYSGGYGGKAWGQIADVLQQFVHGKITAEMMLDTAFTLCHNNGPIFNKGMLYDMYNAAAIREILDVQRAGMIPAYVRDVSLGLGESKKYAGKQFVIPPMWNYVQKMEGVSLDFTMSVDWARLKTLGAIGNYPHLIPKKVLSPAEQAKMEALAKKQKAEQEAKEKSKFYVMPNVVAYKFKVPRPQKPSEAKAKAEIVETI